MIPVFIFSFAILSCLPLIHSATRTCPETFSCPNMVPFKYPFYNGTDTRCGLIKVNCTSKSGKIQLGRQSYVIISKVDYFSSVLIHNNTFEELVKEESCEALMNNFTSPSPLLFSISIAPFITLFKCTKKLGYSQNMEAYFGESNYYNHSRCKDYNFYYKKVISSATVPSDLPQTCQVIQLPVRWRDNNATNIFSLLLWTFTISFKLTDSCDKCRKKGGHCQTKNGFFQCSDARKDKSHLKIILGLAGSAFILMLCFFVFIIWRRCKGNPFSNASSKNKTPDLEDRSLCCGVSIFSYTELKEATGNFSPSHELGDGGFGAVYYGKLQDGREVAVKRLYEHNYKRAQQFMNEVEILTRLRHPNLVVLYGCTSQQSHELLIVYEYIPNGTIADHLHGEQAKPTLLTWPIRMKIAIETASALVYLHASEIIHRDVKTNNILLDHSFSIKLADFGLSRLVPNNATHVSTAPQGTPGYLDPQYHQRYQLTDKSDVYSFGVVLIELISSMVAVDLNRSQDEVSLANLALNRIQRCALDQLIDPCLVSDRNGDIMNMITLVADLGFRCLQYDSEMRPTMNEVLEVLMDIQAEGKLDAHDKTITELETLKAPPPSETNDAVVLLEFLPSPISITSKWESEKFAPTAVSSNGNRLLMKNSIIT